MTFGSPLGGVFRISSAASRVSFSRAHRGRQLNLSLIYPELVPENIGDHEAGIKRLKMMPSIVGPVHLALENILGLLLAVVHVGEKGNGSDALNQREVDHIRDRQIGICRKRSMPVLLLYAPNVSPIHVTPLEGLYAFCAEVHPVDDPLDAIVRSYTVKNRMNSKIRWSLGVGNRCPQERALDVAELLEVDRNPLEVNLEAFRTAFFMLDTEASEFHPLSR
ncbi:MAG: hypothetical protein RQM90_00710 [Methanoculleus sp.]